MQQGGGCWPWGTVPIPAVTVAPRGWHTGQEQVIEAPLGTWLGRLGMKGKAGKLLKPAFPDADHNSEGHPGDHGVSWVLEQLPAMSQIGSYSHSEGACARR